MNLTHPVAQEFAQEVDLACGRMERASLAAEAMYWLADDLACMLDNDSFEKQSRVPQSQELHRLMVAIMCHLESRKGPQQQVLDEALAKLAMPQAALAVH